MATFITTIKFTPQGLGKIQETCQRAEAFKATAKKMGCEITAVYWTPGAFDGVLIFDAPSVDSASALMLRLSAAGNVHTQTTRAFTAAEMEKILKTASTG
jgi:uncharacterized protein with GYD domain